MYRLNNTFIIVIFIILLFKISASSQKISSESVEVSFNHLVLFVDSNTYSSIKNSVFLKNEFATYEHRTTVRSNDSYTGIYFYGTNTYIEFFDADADTIYKVGDCGIGLSTNDTNGIVILKDLLSGAYDLTIDTVSRQWDSLLIPWYSYISPENPFVENDFVIWTWTMKYMPEFLERWHPQQDASDSGITRKEVLNRYKLVLGEQAKKPIMSDVVGVTIAADSQEIDGLITLFGSLGFNVMSSGAGTNLHRGDFLLNIVLESADTRGLTEIRFRTNKKPVPNDPVDFGQKSVLSFPNDTMAIWSFHF